MARVSVRREDYQEGRLPSVCVLSGEAADELLLYQTPVPRRSPGGAGGALIAALERLAGFLGAARTYEGLAGRIPVSGRRYRRLLERRRMWSTLLSVGFLCLVAAAWVGVAWSPAAALVSGTLIVVAGWHRLRWRRALPRAEPSHGGSIVVLDNVHESFAAALARRP